ncbi:peptidylprolyl isomerase [Tenacibaculum sp. L6]|uniref:peptidylprolyl isomerase n=1 Tax=Tenacibaculum sp. L6 TaxID=2992764 RepID=UPI00237B579D|nr:peptidylprolyl isomerase [Tenacibaculum sp. L6]MDE0535123.1 peptidylprolyl isomerase [Tenacibaculum sp. L6]
MIKFKHLLYTVAVGTLLYACGTDSNPRIENFDHEAQAIKDQDSIVKFLKTHYYKDAVDSIKPLIDGETALMDDVRLKSRVVNEYDIDYTYYYFVKEEGVSEKGYPTVVDSVLTTYRLSSLDASDKLTKVQDLNTPTWFNASQIAVRGWLHAFTHFKGGELKKEDDGSPYNGPITYNGTGKGFFLLPSGLSYRNSGNLPNKTLLYFVSLHDIVENTDHDQDGVPSIFEDVDEDGKPWNDDTDKNNVPNYLDIDDDGDGVLTKDEDKNGDGDPRNDFNDPNKPNVPDYLNRDIRVKY